MANHVVLRTDLSGAPVRRGKVRDVYDLGDHLIIVATDRISAFDVVMANGIPDKGRILTALSRFWFERLSNARPHHLMRIIDEPAHAGAIGQRAAEFIQHHLATLRGRSMLCVRADVVPIECVVRGYLAGSGWKEYQETGRVCGVALPPGLQPGDKLPEPIFTPATKADEGHDENISFEQACALAGGDVMRALRERSVRLYVEAADYARPRGVMIADTKFEFGRRGGELLLIDEVLTPDSSRFWPSDKYEAGRDQESFDKQYVRNYLETLVKQGRWNKTPPGPELPTEVVQETRGRYVEAYRLLTGRDFS